MEQIQKCVVRRITGKAKEKRSFRKKARQKMPPNFS